MSSRDNATSAAPAASRGALAAWLGDAVAAVLFALALAQLLALHVAIVARLPPRTGRTVEVVGYNRAAADIVDKFALHDKTGFELGAVPH
ncbi:hypothetical protein [Sphingopyxis terrae]|uniref:hypothetical protein n=1 Tax=Sphingopyxis terrae TaxID=33052 RepID=UPI00362AE710